MDKKNIYYTKDIPGIKTTNVRLSTRNDTQGKIIRAAKLKCLSILRNNFSGKNLIKKISQFRQDFNYICDRATDAEALMETCATFWKTYHKDEFLLEETQQTDILSDSLINCVDESYPLKQLIEDNFPIRIYFYQEDTTKEL